MNPLQSITAELDRLKGLAEAATPGEWTANFGQHPEAVRQKKECITVCAKEPSGHLVQILSKPRDYSLFPETWQRWCDDAAFFADSRTSVPRLAAALEVAVEAIEGSHLPQWAKEQFHGLIASKLCPAGEEGK